MMESSATPINKKFVVVGDGATGKTALLYRFKNNNFDPKYEPTIFEAENMECLYDGKKVNVSLWDTAGQEDFEAVRVLAYDNTDILLVIFSIVSRASFTNVRDVWVQELEKNRSKFPKAKILLVGTKSDLKNSDQRDMPGDADISKAEGDQLAKEIKATCYMETSSKTGDGIKEVFDAAMKAAMGEGKKGPKYCILI